MAERQAAKMRLEYQDAEQIRIQFQDEVNTPFCVKPVHGRTEHLYNFIVLVVVNIGIWLSNFFSL